MIGPLPDTNRSELLPSQLQCSAEICSEILMSFDPARGRNAAAGDLEGGNGNRSLSDRDDLDVADVVRSNPLVRHGPIVRTRRIAPDQVQGDDGSR